MSESTQEQSEDSIAAIDAVADEQFEYDPISDDRSADSDHPVVIIPRGGANQIGRSCFHVQTPSVDVLVDAGLNQGEGGDFPDFRGIDEGQIDAVFLTHAHVDHSGALPVLEAENLFAPDARVICTRPTAAIAHQLLHDSLKIHSIEARENNRSQRYYRDDVHDVFERIRKVDYGTGTLGDYVQRVDDELRFEFGDAGHLLGSAWVMLESHGRRVVFSGDIGNTSAHLKQYAEPPAADTLLLESTYGGLANHRNFESAKTELWQELTHAVAHEIPVLIPSFAVGRAQELLQLINDRFIQLSEEKQSEWDVIVDGMAQDGTQIYNAWGRGEYVQESINNRITENHDTTPFLPDCARLLADEVSHAEVLDGESAPIIISTSGMLVGGPSPSYLLHLVEKYEEAKILFTGYQAEGTPGRTLLEGDGDDVTVTVPATRWDPTEEIEDIIDSINLGSRSTIVRVPTDWVTPIEGFSGHAAQQTLLHFTRDVSPTHINLVHGDAKNQQALAAFLEDKTEVDTITRAKIMEAFPATQNMGELPEKVTDALEGRNEDQVDETLVDALTGAEEPTSEDESVFDEEVEARLHDIETRIAAVAREATAARHETRWTEQKLRELIRDEIGTKST
jgi:metallo-beta-lactamase family protein